MRNEKTIWETENLTGTLSIEKNDGTSIYYRFFEMPAAEATGPDAQRKILAAASCHCENIRRVSHSLSLFVGTHPVWSEHFCFRRPDLPDIRYEIGLANDDSASRMILDPEDFPSRLEQIREKQCREVCFRFCPTPEKSIPAVSRVTELRYLTLFCCSTDSSTALFREIGRLEQLRGLCLHGRQAFFELDRAGVGELRKLKNLESLAIIDDFPVAADALPELGTLKTLKALHLSFGPNCGIETCREKLVTVLSFLQKLENLEFLILSVPPRLSPAELALPPSLRYLEINRHVCRLPGRKK